MFGSLLAAMALVASQDRLPAEPPPGETVRPGAFTLRLNDEQHPSVTMSVAGETPGTRLIVFCDTRNRNGVISVSFPERISGPPRSEIRYSFDNGPEYRGRWIGGSGVIGGGGVIAIGGWRMGAFEDFFPRLRGTRSVRLSALGPRRGWQEVAFSYDDPGAMLDEMNRRCRLNL
jgi:hypothetical protein